ncbi:MAG: hypothetical protein ACOY4H_15070 [Thermodesulfobacteriota bacterium]
MVYVERDSEGKITAIHHAPHAENAERRTLSDQEVLAFLEGEKSEVWIKLLSLSDLSTIRIIEDLIELLISKNVIQFTELPEAAQRKILERRAVRSKIEGDTLMVEDIL